MTDIPSTQSIGRNALWSVLNQFVGQFLVLIVFFITARFVSKEAFGVMALCMLAVELFRQVTVESVGTSLAVKKDPDSEDYNAGFILAAVGCVLSAIVVFLGAAPMATFLDLPDLEVGLKLVSAVIIFMGLARAQETWMMKNMMFRTFTIRSVLAIAIGGGVGIYMAINGYGLLSLLAQQILSTGFSLVFVWFTCPWRPNFRTTRYKLHTLFSYSRHLAFNAMTSVVGSQSDIFLSSYYLGAAPTGLYNGAKRILVATQAIVTAGLNSVILPIFAASSHRKEDLRNMHMQASVLTAIITAPLYIGLAFLSHEIIEVLLGKSWVDVAPVLSILIVAAFVSSIDQYNSNIILVCGKPQWQTRLVILRTIITLVLVLSMARYGLIELALSLLLIPIIFFPISLRLSLSLTEGKIGPYLNALFPVVTSALLMGCIVHYAQFLLPPMSPHQKLLILVPTGAAVYFTSLILLDRQLFLRALFLIKAIFKTAKSS